MFFEHKRDASVCGTLERKRANPFSPLALPLCWRLPWRLSRASVPEPVSAPSYYWADKSLCTVLAYYTVYNTVRYHIMLLFLATVLYRIE